MKESMIHARCTPETIRDLDARRVAGMSRSDTIRAAVYSWLHRPAPTAEEYITITEAARP
jgi:hypothetical protein